jgi:exopolysaccharide biosynthesis polyprenyl glycosylphosphotransferase
MPWRVVAPPAVEPSRRHHRRGWLIRRALLVADMLALSLAFLIAEGTMGGSGQDGNRLHLQWEFVVAVAMLPIWIFVAKLYGLYDRDEERTDHSTVDEFVTVFHLVTVCIWVFFLAAWVTQAARPDVAKLAVFWGSAATLVTVCRSAARAICRRHPGYKQNTVVVGAGDIGQRVARKLLQHPEYGLALIGFIDDEPKAPHAGMQNLPLLGAPSALPELCRRYSIERVVIAFSREDASTTLDLVRSLRELDVQIDFVPRLFEVLGPSATMHSIEGLPLVGLPPVRLTRSWRMIKRGFDVAVSAVMLVLAAPVFLAVAIVVRLESPGPVLFRQNRLGRDLKEFTAVKFRTMRADVDHELHRDYIRRAMNRDAAPETSGRYKLERPEITRVGRFLRTSSLDELPQLLNVLRGDMSLVGPRPCLGYETEFFEPHQFERFLVPQGLTGLWQVTARARSTFAEALDMDVAYARGWSFGLDLKILFKTPLQLFRLRGSV